MLSRRALSEGEILLRLARKGFSDAQAAAALRRLRELGLADDRALCAALVRHCREERRLGPRKIAGMLASRRISRAVIEDALRSAAPGEELATARAALARKFRGGIPPGRGGAARAYRFLAGRGFSPESCREAIRGPYADIVEGED
jgi:SOS response regulatory protein OraA/RecX